MPIYSYACDACEFEWEENHTFENRDFPVSCNCPNCEESGSIRRTYKLNFSCDNHAVPKLNNEQKDLFRQIKKANKGSTIPDY